MVVENYMHSVRLLTYKQALYGQCLSLESLLFIVGVVNRKLCVWFSCVNQLFCFPCHKIYKPEIFQTCPVVMATREGVQFTLPEPAPKVKDVNNQVSFLSHTHTHTHTITIAIMCTCLLNHYNQLRM